MCPPILRKEKNNWDSKRPLENTMVQPKKQVGPVGGCVGKGFGRKDSVIFFVPRNGLGGLLGSPPADRKRQKRIFIFIPHIQIFNAPSQGNYCRKIINSFATTKGVCWGKCYFLKFLNLVEA